MLLIDHRINTLEQLRAVPVTHGIEIDLRDYDGAIRLAHDPFTGGERLEDFLAEYRHAFIIFNTKSDGLEQGVLDLVHKFKIRDYFFLDVALPSLIQLVKKGVKQAAVRYSEHEPLEFALSFAGKVDWVWVDCFTRLPLDPEIHARLKEHFKLCLVSPELQRHPRAWIGEFRSRLAGMPVDAVCTDFCEDWTA